MAMNIRAHVLRLALPLFVLAAPPLFAQGSAANADPQAVHARAARKAQLMAEFRALLEQTEARLQAQAGAAANPAVEAAGATRAPTAPAIPPAASAPAPASPTPVPRWPKDATQDFTGQPCEYFTRPPQGSSPLLMHAEGRWVAYGTRMYQCVNQRWRLAGPVAAYADGEQRRAELLER